MAGRIYTLIEVRIVRQRLSLKDQGKLLEKCYKTLLALPQVDLGGLDTF